MYTKKPSIQKEFGTLPLADQVVEVFYNRASELVKPVFYALNDVYPMAERKKNPKIEYRYAEAYNQAKYHRNFYKKIVRESIVPLAILKKHIKPFEADGPTTDFRCLIENQFKMLHKRLKDYAGLLVPKTHEETLLITLDKVLESELFLLLNNVAPEGIVNYQAIPRYTDPEGF